MSDAMMLLGMVEMQNPRTGEKIALEVTGFDIVGFFFPFFRLLLGGQWGMFALFCVTFYLYPFWCWYVGFRYKRARFEKYLKQGWQLVEKDRRAA
jgi:hypothetical protein